MTAVVVTYIFGEPRIALGRFIPIWVAYLVGGVLAAGLFGFHIYLVLCMPQKMHIDISEKPLPEEEAAEAEQN